MVIVALGFFVIGAGLLAVGVTMLRRGASGKRETASWVRAQGIVIGVERGSVAPMTADATVTLRYPIVRFVDADGRQHEGKAQTAVSWQRPQEGQPVGLRYDPADPRRIVVDGAPAGNGPIGTCAGVLFTVFGVFWILIGLLTLGLLTR